jgi:ubiquinone/menaquinone biosynthesis C-methylase UbiE
MGHHVFDPGKADRLERAQRRYRYLSAEELVWALSPSPGAAVADLGSGTGFYTDHVADHVGTVYAIDVQPAMHAYYREKGLPDNADLLTATVDALPLATGGLEAAFSTMTYHEFATEAALSEVRRVLVAGGRLVVVDWAATGTGTAGPPLDDRFSCEEVCDALRAVHFEVAHAALRPETFLVVADAPAGE